MYPTEQCLTSSQSVVPYTHTTSSKIVLPNTD